MALFFRLYKISNFIAEASRVCMSVGEGRGRIGLAWGPICHKQKIAKAFLPLTNKSYAEQYTLVDVSSMKENTTYIY